MSICPSFALMIIFLIDSYWEINPNPKGVESMDKIKVSLDEEGFRDKPKDEAIGKISSRIGASIKEVSCINMKKFALVVGRGGYTFALFHILWCRRAYSVVCSSGVRRRARYC